MEIFLSSPFYEVAALTVLAAAVGLLGVLLRQPLIVSFLAVGVLAGPSALDIVRATEEIGLLARLGVAVLLFLVGLKLNVGLIRSFGRVALMTGIGQVLFTSLVGFAICLALGMSAITSAYVAVALTFSSTIIIVKLLSDKREIDSLHGRIAVGFLIVQDLVVVLAMIVLSALGAAGASDQAPGALLRVLLGGTALGVVVWLFTRYLAEPLLARVARSPELLVTFAIGWAAVIASAADYLGLGKELGGLVAGVALGSTSFREAIGTRLASLRDFPLLFFFIELGSLFDLSAVGTQVGAAVVLSVFVLVGNPLIVMIIMGAMGYRKRTGLLAGLTVAQISEFSLVFIAMGLSLGQVGPEAVGLTTLVGLITIGLSTYMILYSHPLYAALEPVLGIFERKTPFREPSPPPTIQPADAIVFGTGRYGSAITRTLIERGLSVLGVDFDPEAVKAWRALGLPIVFGDASDPDFIATLPLGSARWVVATIPGPNALAYADTQLGLVSALRGHGYAGKIALSARDPADIEQLHSAGADIVLVPLYDAAREAAERILAAP